MDVFNRIDNDNMIGYILIRIAARRRVLINKFWSWYCILKCIDQGVFFSKKKSVQFKGHCYIDISRKSNTIIGNDFVCNSGLNFGIETYESKITVAPNAKLYIGNNTGISSTVIGCFEEIHIGNNVNIGGGTRIMDSNFHCLDWKIRQNRMEDCKNVKTSPILIEDNVFIGARCIICKGVKIGARSIIAAGSVVIKDIPEDCIAGGNPCKIIKRINNEEA